MMVTGGYRENSIMGCVVSRRHSGITVQLYTAGPFPAPVLAPVPAPGPSPGSGITPGALDGQSCAINKSAASPGCVNGVTHPW
jgi:hypothetical protein